MFTNGHYNSLDPEVQQILLVMIPLWTGLLVEHSDKEHVFAMLKAMQDDHYKKINDIQLSPIELAMAGAGSMEAVRAKASDSVDQVFNKVRAMLETGYALKEKRERGF